MDAQPALGSGRLAWDRSPRVPCRGLQHSSWEHTAGAYWGAASSVRGLLRALPPPKFSRVLPFHTHCNNLVEPLFCSSERVLLSAVHLSLFKRICIEHRVQRTGPVVHFHSLSVVATHGPLTASLEDTGVWTTPSTHCGLSGRQRLMAPNKSSL